MPPAGLLGHADDMVQLGGLALVLTALVGWALVSDRARVISAPIFFVAVGLLLAEGVDLLHFTLDPHLVKLVAELTLVWVLFADASRVHTSTLRHDASLYVRLLGIGLPLTVLLGSLVAASLLGLSPWYALLVGAALAPTDAALGASVMTDTRVPYRIRQTLNVESGLNDGIATPIVTLALAGIVLAAGSASGFSLTQAALGLPVGVLVGVAIGLLGGTALRLAHRRSWSSEELAGPAVLALALLAYVVAVLLLANGYVAAFVGGIAFGRSAGRGGEAEVYYVEQTCGLASMICWLLFGALAVPTLAQDWSWRILAYALVSLTLVRMLPVVLVLVRSGLDRPSILFMSWFGPRGLASVIFALLATEELHGITGAVDEVVATIGLTVLLSVLLHGFSAQPLIARYARSGADIATVGARDPIPVRHLVKPVTGPDSPDTERRQTR
jgi:NhaP-type Na+/H+ or K+/H+ antiporter